MKKKILIIVSAVVLILFSLSAFYYYSVSSRNEIEKLVEEKKLVNIMIAGSNIYDNNRHKFFAIVSINPQDHNIGVTFIPPEFKIDMDDDGRKIRRLDQVDFDYFSKIQRSIRKDLKLTVPFCIELYSSDIRRLVDLIEGIDLFVLDQMKDTSNLDFGVNYFDGERTVRYINSVHDNSIYLKFDRIQDILFTLYRDRPVTEKFINIDFIRNVVKSIKSNMLPQEFFTLCRIIYEPGNISATILPGGMKNGFYMMDDITSKIYESEFLNPLIVNSMNKQPGKIKILNGTNVSGLARKMRNLLIREGLNVVEFGTSPYQRLKKSIIVCRKGNIGAVEKASELAGIKRIHYITDSTLLNNVLIIIGEDLAR